MWPDFLKYLSFIVSIVQINIIFATHFYSLFSLGDLLGLPATDAEEEGPLM